MDAQDILKTLHRLEQNLQNVESARQQVANTVNAYEGAKNQLHALTVEFSLISSELKNVYSAIKENVDTIDNTLRKKIETVFNDVNAKAKALEDAAFKIQSSFEESCRKSAQTLLGSIDENMQKINGEMDKCIVLFNQKADLEMEGITTALSKFKLAVEEIQEGFIQSMSLATENNKIKLEKIVTDFGASIQEHVSSFTSLKNELFSIIKQYNETSKTLTEKINNIACLLTQETANLQDFRNAQIEEYNEIKDIIDNTAAKIIKNQSENIEKTESKLLSRINFLENEIAASKKFTIICLALLVIYVLINFIAIIK